MKKYICTIVVVVSIFAVNHVYAEKFTIAKVPEFEQLLGSFLLEEIYKRAGHEVEFVELPSPRALLYSSKGIVDGEANRIYAIGERFPTLKRVPTPFTVSTASAFIINQKVDITKGDWESLRGYRIGYQRGAAYAETALKDYPSVSILNTTLQLLQMLQLDRLDIAVTMEIDGTANAIKHNLERVIELNPVTLHTQKVYHYLHESKAYVIPELNKVIIEMTESGELDQLREKMLDKVLSMQR